MIASVDTIIFLGFLVVNIVLGLTSSRGIKTIREYAIGDKHFSTATIVATIVATWVSGEFFFTIVSESYSHGLHFIWIVVLGNFLCLFLTGYFFVPRMAEFLGKLSIAEAMGDLFGKKVRIISAISSFIGVAGIISVQLKIAGLIFEYAVGFPSFYGVLSAGIVITLYSALGGIKSVTFTDIIQFLTFATIIPVISYFLLESLDSTNLIIANLTTNPLFDFQKVFDFSQTKNITYLFLFLWILIPSFNPAIFQRVSMAKDVVQAKKSFIIAALTCMLLVLIVCWIGVLMMSRFPNIETNNIVEHLLDLRVIGIKGLLLTGIMAMVMSTVDSYINSTAVIIIHDFLKPLKIKFIKNQLLSTRIVSAVLGVVSILFCLREGSFLNLLVFSCSFWMPVVTVPFIMAILGFRSTEKSVLLGMAAGIITVLAWDYLLKITVVNSVPVGMFMNLIILMSSHYLLKQSGGWVGIKNPEPLIIIRKQRKEKLRKLLQQIKGFNLIDACNRNCPKGDGLISILGFFAMISAFTSTHTLSKNYQLQYSHLIAVLYPMILIMNAALISYPLWLHKWKNTNIIGIVWNTIMIIELICFSFSMVIISGFSQIQLVAFLVNIMIISTLSNWSWSLITIIFGVCITALCFNYYFITDLNQINFLWSQFETFYLLLLVSSVLVLFLKPKQQHQELTEDNNLFLSSKVEDQKHELSRLHELKNEFLRNLEHEAHTPITGITSMGQVLWENYDKLSEKQRRKATQEIAKSSERLNSLVNNLIDLSKLENLNYKLNKTKVNLTDLVYERVEICQKLYFEEKDKENLNFDLKIEDKLTALCDEYYTARTIDNIVINAIQYSTKGTITIELKSSKNNTVEFSVRDEGIGIPKEELLDIFDPFTVSSKTKTPAGGRGIGLTLCKKVITAHGGTITASSKSKGSLFRVILPQ